MISSLRGGNDNDMLRGGLGVDDLQGGTGDDAIFGDDGNDIIKGGNGISAKMSSEPIWRCPPSLFVPCHVLQSPIPSTILRSMACELSNLPSMKN